MHMIYKNAIHIWTIKLNTTYSNGDLEILNAQEKDKVFQFKTKKLQNDYVVSHAAVRKILASYLQINPRELLLVSKINQKPYLDLKQNLLSLQFNLSHSCEFALLAVTLDSPIGIDIEHIREVPQCLQLAKRFFSDKEHKYLSQCSSENQNLMFLKYWTAKEAFLKAKGLGITGYLHRHTFHFENDRVFIDKSLWQLTSLPIHPHYIATCAIENYATKQFSIFQYQNNKTCS